METAPNLKMAITAGIGSDHVDLQAAITNANSVATALGNQSQSIAMPVEPSAFSAYSSNPYSAGEIISPDGLVTKVATNQMRGTFDPKKQYNSQNNPSGTDPQTGMTPLLPHVVHGGVSSGKGTYFTCRFCHDDFIDE